MYWQPVVNSSETCSGASKDICYEMINVEPNAVEDVLTFVYTGK